MKTNRLPGLWGLAFLTISLGSYGQPVSGQVVERRIQRPLPNAASTAEPDRQLRKPGVRRPITSVDVTTAASARAVTTPLLEEFTFVNGKYEAVYEQKEQQQIDDACKSTHEANQKLLEQIAYIDKLLEQKQYASLQTAYQNKQLPIDSLTIRGTELQFIRVSVLFTSLSGCKVPAYDLQKYPTLLRLEQEGKAEVVALRRTFAAMRVAALPPLTGNVAQDAANYLRKVKDLLQQFYTQFKTTFPQYQSYEQRQRLATAKAQLDFRKEFCYKVLCEVK